jgi:hypothetical protein
MDVLFSLDTRRVTNSSIHVISNIEEEQDHIHKLKLKYIQRMARICILIKKIYDDVKHKTIGEYYYKHITDNNLLYEKVYKDIYKLEFSIANNKIYMKDIVYQLYSELNIEEPDRIIHFDYISLIEQWNGIHDSNDKFYNVYKLYDTIMCLYYDINTTIYENTTLENTYTYSVLKPLADTLDKIRNDFLGKGGFIMHNYMSVFVKYIQFKANEKIVKDYNDTWKLIVNTCKLTTYFGLEFYSLDQYYGSPYSFLDILGKNLQNAFLGYELIDNFYNLYKKDVCNILANGRQIAKLCDIEEHINCDSSVGFYQTLTLNIKELISMNNDGKLKSIKSYKNLINACLNNKIYDGHNFKFTHNELESVNNKVNNYQRKQLLAFLKTIDKEDTESKKKRKRWCWG